MSVTAALSPVMFAPGRARLATTPWPTGSPTPVMTTGIVAVAFFAASAAGVPRVTIRSTFDLTSSAPAAENGDFGGGRASIDAAECRGTPDGMPDVDHAARPLAPFATGSAILVSDAARFGYALSDAGEPSRRLLARSDDAESRAVRSP